MTEDQLLRTFDNLENTIEQTVADFRRAHTALRAIADLVARDVEDRDIRRALVNLSDADMRSFLADAIFNARKALAVNGKGRASPWSADVACVRGVELSTLTDRIAQARADERAACLRILRSAEPNTTAERIVEKLHAVVADCPLHVAGLIAELCTATADELAELAAQVEARGPSTKLDAIAMLAEAEQALLEAQNERDELRRKLDKYEPPYKPDAHA